MTTIRIGNDDYKPMVIPQESLKKLFLKVAVATEDRLFERLTGLLPPSLAHAKSVFLHVRFYRN
jgi:hypothetical protein